MLDYAPCDALRFGRYRLEDLAILVGSQLETIQKTNDYLANMPARYTAHRG